jgi:mono/diheme cytochrome c family protein
LSDERSGRELTPRPEEEAGAVTPREGALPAPSTEPAERFHAGESAHTVGLTEERAAKIVRQSGNARFMAFLGALILVLFIPFYWIYDIGLPFLGMDGRLAAEEQGQYVTDVARGHELYLANCALCHGNNGEGGIGPILNDQGKLYQAVTPEGLPGSGHFNPAYLEIVMHTGGRYICGDPNSLMPAWIQPAGPLNYREIEEIIAFMLASNEISWVHQEEHHEADATPGEATEMSGWRDPNYEPPPDATPVPACWREPGGVDPGNGNGTAEPIESPGTVENPRVIEIEGTETLQWVDPETGQRLTTIGVVEGETIEFQIINASDVVPHNFHIGPQSLLETAGEGVDAPGVDTFTGGTETFTYTFDDIPEQPQFACTVPGHYSTMHGDFAVQQPNGEPADGEGEGDGDGDGETSPAPDDGNGASPVPGDQ